MDASRQLIEDDSITTTQNIEQQWGWFDSLQRLINDGDQVIFDFTHGFRSVPIIFSTAISFLQKVKCFELLHAYYGYSDQWTKQSEIIDMAKFYRINEWADGVARLVDTADASKLAELAEEAKDDGFASLNDPELIQALRDLTDLIKNIDINNVGKKADEALSLIQNKRNQCSGADKQLLSMVVEKFGELSVESGHRYDLNYFKLQIILAEMLLKHKLYMQAFTVIRECIGSLVLVESYNWPRNYQNKYQGKARYKLSSVFISLLIAGPENSNYKDSKGFQDIAHPLYLKLSKIQSNPINILQSFIHELTDLRNGFNHAWISKNGVPCNLHQQGEIFLNKLKQVIEILNEHKTFN
jgi:CRISPR-associated DxTHG motif protein